MCEAEQELLFEGAGECGLQVSEEYIREGFVDVMVVLNVADECVYCVEGRVYRVDIDFRNAFNAMSQAALWHVMNMFACTRR